MRILQIILNGKALTIKPGTTVAALVASLTEDPRGVAIERNMEIVPKALHNKTKLIDGDQLELVQFVGGG